MYNAFVSNIFDVNVSKENYLVFKYDLKKIF